MAKPKRYTEGNWKARPDMLIAADWPTDFPSWIAQVNMDCYKVKANAQLISAAPELYEALKLLTDPQYQLEETKMGYAIFRLPVEKIEQIAAALAKAEGR